MSELDLPEGLTFNVGKTKRDIGEYAASSRNQNPHLPAVVGSLAALPSSACCISNQ